MQGKLLKDNGFFILNKIINILKNFLKRRWYEVDMERKY